MMSREHLLFLGLLYLNLVSISTGAWSLLFHIDLPPLPLQIPLNDLYRYRRQVVTPDWLMGPVILPNSQAAKVRVTPQNLRETAAIRASIQKAVNEGTYVVATDPKQFQIALTQLGYGNQWPITSMAAPFMLPRFTWVNPWANLGQQQQQLQQQKVKGQADQ